MSHRLATPAPFAPTVVLPSLAKKVKNRITSVFVWAWDHAATTNPTAHVWISEKPSWLNISDYLKRTDKGIDG
jgi:hypothetical protein